MSHLAQAVKVSIEIHNLKTELDEIPVKVREVESELKGIETSYLEKKTERDRIDSEKRQLETEQKGEVTTLAEKEKRLNAIKTQKEYQAVTREITIVKTANREREIKITQFQSDLENFATDLGPLEERLTALKAQLAQERSSIQGTLDNLENRIQALETDLQQQLSALPDEIREQYQRIERMKQPPAALVVSGTCQACFMAIPPQLFIEIQKGHQVHSCPNCHRLLYLNED